MDTGKISISNLVSVPHKLKKVPLLNFSTMFDKMTACADHLKKS